MEEDVTPFPPPPVSTPLLFTVLYHLKCSMVVMRVSPTVNLDVHTYRTPCALQRVSYKWTFCENVKLCFFRWLPTDVTGDFFRQRFILIAEAANRNSLKIVRRTRVSYYIFRFQIFSTVQRHCTFRVPFSVRARMRVGFEHFFFGLG